MGMIRGSEGSVVVFVGEVDSAGSLVLSKGLFPSVPEVGAVVCGLEVIGDLLEDARELEEDENKAVEGIWGRLEAPDPFSLPPSLESFKEPRLGVGETSWANWLIWDLEEAHDDSPPGLGGREAILTGLGGREANPVFADWCRALGRSTGGSVMMSMHWPSALSYTAQRLADPYLCDASDKWYIW
jgi:hypothetical protein